MKSEVKNILRKIYIDYGEEVFAEKQKLLAYISDLLNEFTVERKRLSLAINEGIVSKIINSDKQSNFEKFNLYATILIDTFDISQSLAEDIINTIYFAIYGVEVKLSVEIDKVENSLHEPASTPTKKSNKIIGIDFGTSNSCVAVIEGRIIKIINNADGNKTTPSVVGFMPNGEIIVGQIAKNQAVVNLDRTIMSIKRKLGSSEKYTIDGKVYTPEDITSIILSRLKKDAEIYLGEIVSQAVITVPAYFNDSQRQAIKKAGKLAGFEVLRIINESTAAAISYGMNVKKQKIMVFDLGGGMLDVSIIDIGDDVFEVIATNGNTKLGGDDFDQRIIDYLVSEFRKNTGINLLNDKMALQRLKEAAEKAKIELSSTVTTHINLPFITADATGPKHMDITITRTKFDELTADLVENAVTYIRKTLSDAEMKVSEIDEILLVGASSRIPSIREAIMSEMRKRLPNVVNPDECIAIGAARQAGVWNGEILDVLTLDVTSFSIGIETAGGAFTKLIEKNTTIPVKRSQVFSTARDGQTSVEVHVLEGENEKAMYNRTLGRFNLMGIYPEPRGVPRIEVTFEIDIDGIVNVTAKDLGSGNEKELSITRK